MKVFLFLSVNIRYSKLGMILFVTSGFNSRHKCKNPTTDIGEYIEEEYIVVKLLLVVNIEL